MIKFSKENSKSVSREEMEQIYQKIKTPKKIGAVIKWQDNFTDSPTIFKYNGKFYMMFIAISKDCNISGYETHIAVSDDLKKWEYLSVIMKRNDLNRWDSKQCAGYTAFYDIKFENECRIEKHNDKFYIAYLAGNSDGYEPDPLFMGLAFTEDILDFGSVKRFSEPILTPFDNDIRPYENRTLYKSCMFKDPLNTTGHPFVNVYNAKDTDNRERIFMAVSDDCENWERYGETAILDLISDDADGIINGDPQIILIDDIYVMFFFRYRKDGPAFNTFACSKDLKNWTVWDGKPLIESENEWENVHAHKTWFIHSNGVNYHFYCAVNNNNERFIAVATSE